MIVAGGFAGDVNHALKSMSWSISGAAACAGNAPGSGEMMSGTAWRGVLLILGSATAFATAGFFTRLVAADAWSILFWRGVFGGLFIAGFVFARERGRI